MYGSHATSIKPYHITVADKKAFSDLSADQRADLISTVWCAYLSCAAASKQKIPQIGSGIPTEMAIKSLEYRGVRHLTDFSKYLDGVDGFLAHEDDKKQTDFIALSYTLKEALRTFRTLHKAAPETDNAIDPQTFKLLLHQINRQTGDHWNEEFTKAFAFYLKTAKPNELMSLYETIA